MSQSTNDRCLAIQPAKRIDKECPIKDIWDRIKEQEVPGFNTVYISGDRSTFLEEYAAKTSQDTSPKRVMLIAHGNKEKYSFDSEHGLKDSKWWSGDTDIIIAHGCYSALILSRDEWKKKFTDWVGNTDKIWHSLDAVSAKIWPVFYRKVCAEFAGAQSGEQMKDQIKDLYFQSMYENSTDQELRETYRIAIQRNLNVLTCRSQYSYSKTA